MYVLKFRLQFSQFSPLNCFFTPQQVNTRSKQKQSQSATAAVSACFSQSFGSRHKQKLPPSQVSCSLEPFCQNPVVTWIPSKKEYYCAAQTQEGTEPYGQPKRSKKWKNVFFTYTTVSIVTHYPQAIIAHFFCKSSAIHFFFFAEGFLPLHLLFFFHAGGWFLKIYKFDVLLSINSTFVVTAYSLNTFVLDNSDSLGDCGPFFFW